MSNSTVFTIGSALRQAENDGLPVGLMVDGQWFAGAIGGLDGDGVLLDAEDGQVTIRLTAISVVRAIRDGSVTPHVEPRSSIAPVLSLTRNDEQPVAEKPVAEAPLDEPAEKLPTVAEQLAAHVDDQTPDDQTPDDQTPDDQTPDADVADLGPVPDDEPVPDEPVDDVLTQLALIEEDLALLEHLPDDVTDDERYALAKRRALMAQRAAASFADPLAIVAGLTGSAIEELQPTTDVAPIEVGRIEPPADQTPTADDNLSDDNLSEDGPTAEPTPLADLSPAQPLRVDAAADAAADQLHPVEEMALVEAAVEAAITAEHAANPLVHSSTQSDDWRAMLVSLRQQAAETPQTTEPEKRRSWRLAR